MATDWYRLTVRRLGILTRSSHIFIVFQFHEEILAGNNVRFMLNGIVAYLSFQCQFVDQILIGCPAMDPCAGPSHLLIDAH